MFGMFKKKNTSDERFSKPLSPEADKFLAEALEDYGQKEKALEQDWRVSECAEYALNEETGLFQMKLNDGTAWEAEAQILGSFNEEDQTWQWAWGNPHCSEVWSRDSKVVQEAGKRLDIWYVHEVPGMPLPGPEFVAYLCAIGMKASESTGMFEAHDGPVVIFLMLKNPRWTSGEAYASATAQVQEQVGAGLAEMIRLIKAGEQNLLPAWMKQFAQSDVHVISMDKDDPSKLFVIGPKDDKNYIAVFTDKAQLDGAVRDRTNVLFPHPINGKALIEQARSNNRGLIINPTDESASVPLPAKMMGAFLEAIKAE